MDDGGKKRWRGRSKEGVRLKHPFSMFQPLQDRSQQRRMTLEERQSWICLRALIDDEEEGWFAVELINENVSDIVDPPSTSHLIAPSSASALFPAVNPQTFASFSRAPLSAPVAHGSSASNPRFPSSFQLPQLPFSPPVFPPPAPNIESQAAANVGAPHEQTVIRHIHQSIQHGMVSQRMDHQSTTFIQNTSGVCAVAPNAPVAQIAPIASIAPTTTTMTTTTTTGLNAEMPAVPQLSYPALASTSSSFGTCPTAGESRADIDTPPTWDVQQASTSGLNQFPSLEKVELGITYIKNLLPAKEKCIFSYFPPNFFTSNVKMAVLNREQCPFLILKPALMQRDLGHLLYVLHAHEKKDVKVVYSKLTKSIPTGQFKVTLKHVKTSIESVHLFPIFLKSLDIFFRGGDVSVIAHRIMSWDADSVKDFSFLA